jgi:hypothetical protein
MIQLAAQQVPIPAIAVHLTSSEQAVRAGEALCYRRPAEYS